MCLWRGSKPRNLRGQIRDMKLGHWQGNQKSICKSLYDGKTVQLYYSGDRRDRYGRAIAQVRIPETGVWLQEEMVRAGYARVYSWNSHVMDTARLYSAEIEARTAKRGFGMRRLQMGFTPSVRPIQIHWRNMWTVYKLSKGSLSRRRMCAGRFT